MAVRKRLQNQLDELEGSDIVLSELEKTVRKAKASAKELARQLTLSRQAQAEWLESELMHTARPLGMNNLKVKISVEPADLGPNGADRVDFKFAFNKNQQLLPVNGVASGGEISRLMLSLKSIIARTMSLPRSHQKVYLILRCLNLTTNTPHIHIYGDSNIPSVLMNLL